MGMFVQSLFLAICVRKFIIRPVIPGRHLSRASEILIGRVDFGGRLRDSLGNSCHPSRSSGLPDLRKARALQESSLGI